MNGTKWIKEILIKGRLCITQLHQEMMTGGKKHIKLLFDIMLYHNGSENPLSCRHSKENYINYGEPLQYIRGEKLPCKKVNNV